jgi:hypothetical protein
MSHEVMADEPAPRSGTSRPDTALDPGFVADLDVARTGPDAATASRVGRRPHGPSGRTTWLSQERARWIPDRWLRRSVTPIALVTVALVALGVGAFAGDSQAWSAARGELLAGTRVLLWADSMGSVTRTPGGQGPFTVQATLASAGSPVSLQRLHLGVGDGTVRPEVALRPGTKASTKLQLRPDCDVLGRNGPDPALLGGARAVVRLPGTRRTQEVPLDVVGDASSVLLSLLAPCSSGGYAPEGSDPASVPQLSVSRMAADPAGRLSFTITDTGDRRAGFDVAVSDAPDGFDDADAPGAAKASVVSASPDGPMRFVTTSSPALPLRLYPGLSVQVTVSVSATCAPAGRALPVTYGVLQPQVRVRGVVVPEAAIDGWDDGVAASAVTAAVVRACAADPTP